jgi:hypothetical protein
MGLTNVVGACVRHVFSSLTAPRTLIKMNYCNFLRVNIGVSYFLLPSHRAQMSLIDRLDTWWASVRLMRLLKVTGIFRNNT